ncbi:3-deoxy-manno-octulosonate cytidylyltransferase [Pelagibacteraceae bacterium]|nr:3-deoxy-manno-octulosonate cytidylyltransferase [Pelagibacteraceae bacterium]
MLPSKKNNFLIVIPARYNSTRFPGKPLVKIKDKTMIQMVWESCVMSSSVDNVVIATDDSRIAKHCEKVGMNYVLTSKKCKTGTDRLIEVAKKHTYDFYVNVQGDEPLVSDNDIRKVIEFHKKNKNQIVNCFTKIKDKKEFMNLNVPKVVINKKNELIYISRSPIPINKKNEFKKAYKQVCIYCFPRSVLLRKGIYNKKSNVEKVEDIEIIRFLEYGDKIKMLELKKTTVAVDTPSDLTRVRKIVQNRR